MIRISLPIVLRIAAAAVLVTVVLLILHWQPARQVRLHQQHLVEAVADRKWKTVGEFFAADYRDAWDQDRTFVLQHVPKVFRDFLACGIESEDQSLEWRGDDGALRAAIRITGSGGPMAQIVMREIDRLSKPFVFTWRRQSWKPWDWALVRVDQPELSLLY